MQTCIDPSPISVVRTKEVHERAGDIIEVKIRCNPVSAGSETYKFRMTIFEYVSLEELLHFLTIAKNTIKGTGMTKIAGRINFLFILLGDESLQKFDILAS